ncbi:hypothetical protein KQX54_008120 [Cotesia glomerata]|uniref:chymotrypsin n=1 Tax=Cotesia glomerata TaxID=32391 RepID=A0AAV7HZB4_COTGL|nr:hypothetical protein KQX54_008120 [Cotesia glomerata]
MKIEETTAFHTKFIPAGALPQNFHARIINGSDVQAGEIPYQVSLQKTFIDGFHFCGGSVLNEKYVITAAHCVEGKTAEQIKVVAATTNLEKPNSTHFVAEIIIHEKYNPSDSWKNDIALIKIEDRFEVSAVLKFVPLPIPNQDIPAESVAVISGWGTLQEGGMKPVVLQKAEVFIASQSYCKQVHTDTGSHIDDNTHICAYDPVHESGPCHGDSGGPLMVGNKLVGLASWVRGCASTIYPSVYTRVPSFLDWIKANAV